VSNSAATPVLVGRARELAELDAALERVRDGRPSAVLIGGEAGVGKSRLAGELRVRTAGAVRVLSGYCLDLSAEGLPFAPFIGVLRELIRDLGADGLAALLPGQGVRDLARLLPELGEPGFGGDPGEARARMFEQVLVLLGQLAETGPVVLVIEDVHWSDRSTRDLLAFLIGNQHALTGVLIVVTFRSDDLHRGHPLRPVLAGLGRLSWVTRLELPRLTRREGRELMAAVLGHEPGPDLARRVFQRSEGNPLFLEVLLRRDGGVDADLPESLRDLVLADVERLPAPSQDVLEALAVTGAWCGHALLASVTGIGGRDLLAALRPAVSANVLVPGAEGYAFRHALIREAVLGQVLPGEKTRLHIRLAEALAADPSLLPPGRAVPEQAHHWYSAHDIPRALASAWQAADAAGQSLAYAEKLTMLARTLELWPMLPDAAQVIGASRVSVLESAVEAAAAAGEDERGVGFADAILAEIDPAREPIRAALMMEQRGLMRFRLGHADSIEELRAALRLMPAEPPTAVRARMLAECARRWMDISEEPGALAMAEEAVALAGKAGDAGTQATALCELASIRSRSGADALALGLFAQARELAGQGGAYRVLLYIVVSESHVLEGMGEHERSVQVTRAAIAQAQEHGLARFSGALLAVNMAESLLSLGRWDEAAEVIDHTLEMSPPRGTQAVLSHLAGELALARGDLATADSSAAACRDALTEFGYRDQNQLPLARLEIELQLAQGSPGDAVAAAEQALDRFNVLHSPRYARPLLGAGARACATVLKSGTADGGDGSSTRADALLERLRVLDEAMEPAGPVQQAHQLAFAAEAALAADAPAADVRAAWDAAEQAWNRLSQPYPAAYALLRAAEAAMAQGDRDAAAGWLPKAAELAGRLGAQPLLQQITQLARRARIDLSPAAAGRPGPAVPFGLTARELEVLRLVAVGRSNQQIATELFISPKTASVHVSNILGKLGVSSRVEAAATAHRLHLLDQD
jgi:ATP/maltotriose-dependent transcriptional regulator MalT